MPDTPNRKTNIKQELNLVRAIKAEQSLPSSIVLLRDWLRDNGYCDEPECQHLYVVRSTGLCMDCASCVHLNTRYTMSDGLLGVQKYCVDCDVEFL